MALEDPILFFRDFDAMSWADEAACRGKDIDIFYPDVGQRITRARAMCARCPVVRKCLSYAVENYETWGIWGGATYRERRDIRRAPDRPTALEIHVQTIQDEADDAA